MAILLQRIATKNYRALADVSVELGDVNVFFGPNGAGKSTFLDVLWFIRDCAIRGVDVASAVRSHGIGILFDGAADGEPLMVAVETEGARYELSLGLSSGRIETSPGEKLSLTKQNVTCIERAVGADKASFFRAGSGFNEPAVVPLREPEKISLGRYLDFETGFDEVSEIDRRLHYIHFYPSRSFDLYAIKQRGSEQSYETWLWDTGKNLWSVLKNLMGRNAKDKCYDTIMDFMRESFPTFDGLVLEQTGPQSVYGSFLELDRRQPILASGVSDGHIQMLLMLTALFAEGRQRTSIMMFDEPEISLHPWALAVLGRAIKRAADDHQKQIIIATHSPVLMSQFEPSECQAVELEQGRTRMKPVSEIENIADLMEQYAIGSLYMSEAIAPQGRTGEAGDE
jgi:predicted ATPase